MEGIQKTKAGDVIFQRDLYSLLDAPRDCNKILNPIHYSIVSIIENYHATTEIIGLQDLFKATPDDGNFFHVKVNVVEIGPHPISDWVAVFNKKTYET